MRDAERVCHAARVGDRARAAAFVLGARDAILRPDFHRHADDIVALLLEQVTGDGAIDSAAHTEDDAWLVHFCEPVKYAALPKSRAANGLPGRRGRFAPCYFSDRRC